MTISKKYFINQIRTYFLSLLFFVSISTFAYSKSIPDFSDLAEELLPSVVSISVMISSEPNAPGTPQFPPGSPFEDFFKDFFERRGVPPRQSQPRQRKRSETAMGSGFIIDSSGYVVTNNHVIANANGITIILYDGTSLQAKLIGSDPKTDIALLKVEPEKPLKAVSFGNSDKIKVGNWALAIGNPFGLVNSVTLGIISAIARDIKAGPFDNFIQTDAPINRGNSGGPLFNLSGEVIGVNTAIYSPSGGSVGIGFAVPSVLAESVVQQLKEHGRTIRGWLGVRIQEITPDLAENLGLPKVYGALVASILPDSPAEKSKVKVGDVVVKFNGEEVTEMRKLPRLVAETKVGKPVEVEVWRDQKILKLNITIMEMNEEDTKTADLNKKIENSTGIIKELGINLSSLTEEIINRHGIPNGVTGLFILNVEQNTDIERKGIRPGDIIVEAEQKPINSIEDIEKIIMSAKKDNRKNILLLMNRKGVLSFVAVKLE